MPARRWSATSTRRPATLRAWDFTITEAGFNDSAAYGPSCNYYGNDAVNAVYTLDLVLDGFKAGAKLTDIYELFDECNASGYNTSFEGYWGLFTTSGAPKPAATDLRNLMAIVGDTGSTAATFAPGSLNYNVSGLASPGQSLLLEKSNGAFDIAVWSDASTDVNGNTTTAPTQNVTVNLGATFATVEVFDPTVGSTAIQTLSNVSSVSLAITDHPLVVEVEPSGSSGTGGTGGTGGPAAPPRRTPHRRTGRPSRLRPARRSTTLPATLSPCSPAATYTINGKAEATSSGVVELEAYGGAIRQLNSQGQWWTAPSSGGAGVLTTAPPSTTTSGTIAIAEPATAAVVAGSASKISGVSSPTPTSPPTRRSR